MNPKFLAVMWAAMARTPSIRLRQLALAAGVAVFGLLSVSPMLAQSSPPGAAPLPSFEVASVKRSRSGGTSALHILPERFIARSYLMRMIIQLAYGHDLGEFGLVWLDVRLEGEPDWVHGGEYGYEPYDIDAKVDDSLAEKFGKDCGVAFFVGSCGYRKQYLLMLQSLLADRFKLKVRWETKVVPAYALVIAKDGPKFLDTKFLVRYPPAADQNLTPPPPRLPPCPAGSGCVQDYMPMERLALWLSHVPQVGRPVIDQTGLTGGYYIKLQWARQQGQAQMSAAPENSDAAMDNAPPLGPAGPSIFTAFQQQLRLKLVPTKGPQETLVIDHIERPSEN